MTPQSLLSESDLIVFPRIQIGLIAWLVGDLISNQDFQTKENYIARRALKKLVDKHQSN